MTLATWTSVPGGDDGGTVDACAEIAHDLRQPIVTIRALVASLRAAEVSPDAFRWHLDSIDGQLEHLGELTSALLFASVPDPDVAPASGLAEEVPFVEATSLVADVVRVFAVTWPGHLTTFFGEQAIVPSPAHMFRRSVRNVLDNAARAAGTAGAIQVSVTTSPTGISIAVEDDGPGFGTLPAQHSIGLKIVDRTVSEAGGRLEITTSEALGGARVSLAFPRLAG
ncbi:MAG: hypothetical protein QOH75_2536 [Actinomycetota bacterium]|nr:hypothetical protein [Actinomycetota bacterium]